MEEVDYSKLSEQYASFLVAVGGVSITVLTLVLSLERTAIQLAQQELGPFLILALVVATVCCFIGAHMMAETAAFFNRAKQDGKPLGTVPLGQRLFLLASANIFISIILVLFALMLLPSAAALPAAATVKWIAFFIFMFVVVGALFWMVLAANYRMPVEPKQKRHRAIGQSIVIGSVWAIAVWILPLVIHERLLLWLTFLTIALIAVGSLLRFAWIFKEGSTSSQEVSINDIRLFSSAITLSYASLVVNAIRTMVL